MWFLCLFSVSTLCAAFNLSWGVPPLSLDRNPPIGDTDNSAYIAMDLEGNAIATWTRTRDKGAKESIRCSFYNHSLRMWTGAMKISGKSSACNSHVALDSQGNALFVWQEGFPSRIYCRSLSREGIWTPSLGERPEEVHFSKCAQQLPQISLTGSGDALVVWEELNNSIEQIHSARKKRGGNWLYLGAISQEGKKARLIPFKSFAQNQKGDAAMCWEQEDSKVMFSFFQEETWSAPILVAEENAYSPSLGLNDLGDTIVVWAQRGAIHSKAFRGSTLRGSFSKIFRPNYHLDRPHVGIDKEGNATVVFERYNSLHKFIAAASLDKTASSWSSFSNISGPSPLDAKSAGYPYFVMNQIGDGVAVWKALEGDRQVIQGAGVSLGTWSSVKTLSSPFAEAGSFKEAYDVSVAMNETGNILAAWTEDPEKTGSQQIKTTAGVGIANIGPKPPVIQEEYVLEGVATGVQVKHRFPAHTDYINILSWDTQENPSRFNVYRGSSSSLIGTTTEPYFEDHQRKPKKREIYLITAVDTNELESSPITIVVHPLEK